MSNTKFTPGPWDSNITASGYLCVFKKWPSKQYPDQENVFEMQTIAVIRPFKDLTEQDMPNGKVLAASPELLELVEELAENLSIQLNRLGCCGEGDGKDRRGDNDSMGGNSLLVRAKELIKKTTL